MHQESLGPVDAPSVATWQETAKVPSSSRTTDVQLRRELNPIVSIAVRLPPGSCRRSDSDATVGFQLRRNLDDLGTTNTFSSH